MGILASGKIPRKAATDAAHIAIAAVHGMDFLLTWNCVHIANAAIAKAILAASKRRQRRSGYKVVSFVPKKKLSA
jgi:hypothetical protein